MGSIGYATYDTVKHQLAVVRPGEGHTRYLTMSNFRPESDRVFGVQVSGDEIWVMVGSHTSQRPNRRLIYGMSRLGWIGSRGI